MKRLLLLLLAAAFSVASFSVSLLFPIFSDKTDLNGVVEPSFQLAKEQSFGFFNDISDENWRRAQTIHAQLFPNHFENNLQLYSNTAKDKGDIPKLKGSANWYARNFQEEFHCPLAQRVPTDSNPDGPKWICDPHRLRSKPDCLVYSFGSNGKAEFEKGVIDHIGPNCEIHTFDPVGANKRHGSFSKALKGYAAFHQWGLGTADQIARQPGSFKTLAATMAALNHTGRTIDILKIDCEWCEWFTYEQLLEQDIRQILIETHNAPMPEAQNMFFSFHDAGFVIFSKEANLLVGGSGMEFGFLKLSKDFFINGTMYNRTETKPAAAH